jgi:hypothetical protein
MVKCFYECIACKHFNGLFFVADVERGNLNGQVLANPVSEGVRAHRHLRRARAGVHVQVWRALPAIRPDHRGAVVQQSGAVAGVRRVPRNAREENQTQRTQRVSYSFY